MAAWTSSQVLFFQRHSGYRQDEMVNNDVVNFLIKESPIPIPSERNSGVGQPDQHGDELRARPPWGSAKPV